MQNTYLQCEKYGEKMSIIFVIIYKDLKKNILFFS